MPSITENTGSNSNPVSDHIINVENNVILTTKDEITVQQVFNYLTTNLDRFRVGSEFVVVCGVHGSDKGELKEGDEDFRYDYEMMYRWFKNHKKYSRQAQIVEERHYNMETVVEVNSVEHESQDEKYVLDEKSKEALKNEFERVVSLDKPIVLVLASCWSFNSEISNILRAVGLYSAINLLEEHGGISAGKMYRLDMDQKYLLQSIAFDEKIKDVILHGT